MSFRDFLTADQINLISEYQEKWRRVSLDTQPIDQIKAAAAVQQAYRVMGKPEPEVIFCQNYRAALDRLQVYIPQVDDPPLPVPMSAEEAPDDPPPFNITVAWKIFKVISKSKKASLNPLLKIQRDLEKSQLISLEKYIDTALPKNLTSQKISEYNRFEQDYVLIDTDRSLG